MAGPKVWTEELIAARVKAGRGSGVGAAYTPWLYVQEFSSHGTQTRVPSPKISRTVHTFSYLERALFLWQEFQPEVLDWNEQRPMDRSITLGYAKQLRIPHPRYPVTRIPIVMTLDAIGTTVDADGAMHMTAWDVKPLRKLQDKRVLAKLSLHRAYCAHVGIPHLLFTEASLPPYVARNIDWIRSALPKEGEIEVVPGLFSWHLDQLQHDLAACRTRPSISHFCERYDLGNKVEPGTGLRIFKMLLWQHRVSVELSLKWIERQPIPRAQQHTAAQPLRRAA